MTGTSEPRGRAVPALTGAAVAAAGLAHFVAPARFDPINELAFPGRARTFTYVHGAVETLIGVGLALPGRRSAARRLGLAYGSYLGLAIARTRLTTRA